MEMLRSFTGDKHEFCLAFCFQGVSALLTHNLFTLNIIL